MSESSSNQGAHAARELAAIRSAERLIHAVMYHGPVGPLDLPPEFMPDAWLARLYSMARTAWADGRSGGLEFLGFIQDRAISEGDKTTLLARSKPIIEPLHSERPENLYEAAKSVRDYHDRRKLHALLRRSEDGEDLDAILSDIGKIKRESRGGAFEILRAGETAGAITAIDFVERLLIEGGASVIYGPSNCGKSFWILDLALSVATGKRFRDELEVDQGAVVYVALEGSTGFRNRIEALRLSGRIDEDTPLFLCFAPVSLLESTHAGRLSETVKQAAKESGLPCRLVVLDTLARAMAGGDENKGQDMTAAVASIDAIRVATGAHVAVVHHCGKDEAKGARGHSSLRAAVDTEIEVSRREGESITTVRVTKQRDLPICDPMPFSLKVVEIGTDRRNNPITSCVVHHEDEMMASTLVKGGRPSKCRPDEMLAYLPASSVSEWQKRVYDETGLSSAQFYVHKRALESAGKFRREAATNRLIAA